MGYIRLPLGIKVAVEYDLNGKAVVNIYHVTTSDPITSFKLSVIAETFRDWVVDNLIGYLSNEIAITGVTAHNLDVPNGEKVTVSVIPPVPGGYEVEAIPNNVASVVSMYTALTGRSFRGRSYIAGVPEAEIGGNEITALIATGLLVSFVQLEADLGVIDSELIVASFYSGGVAREEALTTPVDSFQVNLRVDTQRRRLPKS